MQVTLVKIGGMVIDREEELEVFLRQFAHLPGHKILVHGGGRKASALSEKMGLNPTLVDGRRITDTATLEVVTMVYGGLINKNIVARLQALGCPSAGICGADGNLLLAHKRQHPNIDFGWVGDIDRFDPSIILSLLASGITPVVAPLTHDGKGQLLNTNADTIASTIASGMAKEHTVSLVYCFELSGLLRDINRPEEVITDVKAADIPLLIEQGVISGGMIPKVHNIHNSLQQGIQRVILCKASDLEQVLSQDDPGTGTIFTL